MDREIILTKYNEPNPNFLEKLLGDPKMTLYLGGPEDKSKLQQRHEKYLSIDNCYTIKDKISGKPIGWIGNWEILKNDEQVWETGFSILPEYQGNGLATKATKHLLSMLQQQKRFKFVYAFPHVENISSNLVCKKSGFTLIGEEEGEYPPGSIMRCNVWRYNLTD